MQPDALKGQAFMKAVVKASLWALFSIGVRSQANIDKFIVAFTDNLDKSFKDLGMVSEIPMEESGVGQATVPPSESQTPPVGPPLSVKNIIDNDFILKALEKEGITTIDQLILEMSKRDLKEIKGISDKSVEEIRKAIEQWQK